MANLEELRTLRLLALGIITEREKEAVPVDREDNNAGAAVAVERREDNNAVAVERENKALAAVDMKQLMVNNTFNITIDASRSKCVEEIRSLLSTIPSAGGRCIVAPSTITTTVLSSNGTVSSPGPSRGTSIVDLTREPDSNKQIPCPTKRQADRSTVESFLEDLSDEGSDFDLSDVDDAPWPRFKRSKTASRSGSPAVTGHSSQSSQSHSGSQALTAGHSSQSSQSHSGSPALTAGHRSQSHSGSPALTAGHRSQSHSGSPALTAGHRSQSHSGNEGTSSHNSLSNNANYQSCPSPSTNDNAARSIKCSVCLMSEPNSRLKCRHAFCSDCLMILKVRREAKCPKCRKPFRTWEPVYF